MSRQSSSDPLPYAQVDRAVKPKAATLATILGVTYQHCLGALLEFWESCGDPRELEALVASGAREIVLPRDEVAGRMLMAFGKPVDLDACRHLGLLEARGESYRVRGMSRYIDPIVARLEARRIGVIGGKASAESRLKKLGSARPGLRGPEAEPEAAPEPKPIFPEGGFGSFSTNPTETPNPPEAADSGQRTADNGQRSAVNILAGKKPPAEPRALRASDPRHVPLIEALCAVYQDVMGAKYAFTGWDATAVVKLLAKSDDSEEIVFRWRTALRRSLDQFQTPKTRTLSDFNRDWNKYPAAKRNDFAQELPL